MAKQVTVSMLKEENKAYDDFLEVPVDYDGKEHVIKVYPIFKPSKVKNLVDSLVDFYQNAHKEKVSIQVEEEDDIVAYFIVKYFTDVKFTSSKKAKTIYDEFQTVLNAKVFQYIFKLFPESSIIEVRERINEVMETMQRIQLLNKQIPETIAKIQLESKELIKK